jgi:hypothetical protein
VRTNKDKDMRKKFLGEIIKKLEKDRTPEN